MGIQEQPKITQIGWAGEFFRTVVPALVVVVLLNLFVAQATRVDGHSMDPTLMDGERIIIEKVTLAFSLPARGDIVVLSRPETPDEPPLIKRVIGLPGETVEIRDGSVWIDGEVLVEDYLDQSTAGTMPSLLIPEGHIFVLGDNRGHSNDSRSFGVVSVENIIGQAWLAYWPLSAWRIF